MTANEKNDITLNINGQDYPIRVEARRTLVDAIRDDCGQTGTHIGCEHGVCGTCTVLLNGASIRSCITLAVQADGADISTVEGLAQGGEMHPLQDEFSAKQGLPCGYCTPGMLMTARDIITRLPDADEKRIRLELSGNLCRCTGYVGIVKAIQSAQAAAKAAGLTKPASNGRIGPVPPSGGGPS